MTTAPMFTHVPVGLVDKKLELTISKMVNSDGTLDGQEVRGPILSHFSIISLPCHGWKSVVPSNLQATINTESTFQSIISDHLEVIHSLPPLPSRKDDHYDPFILMVSGTANPSHPADHPVLTNEGTMRFGDVPIEYAIPTLDQYVVVHGPYDRTSQVGYIVNLTLDHDLPTEFTSTDRFKITPDPVGRLGLVVNVVISEGECKLGMKNGIVGSVDQRNGWYIGLPSHSGSVPVEGTITVSKSFKAGLTITVHQQK